MNSHFRACLSFSTFDVWVTRSGDRYLVNQDEGLVQMFPNSNFEVRWTENIQIIWSRGWSKHSHFDHYSYLGHIYAEVAPIPDFRRNLTFYHWCYQASSKSNYQPPHRSTGNSLFCWIAILLTSVIGTTLFWSCFFVHVKFHGCILINDLYKKHSMVANMSIFCMETFMTVFEFFGEVPSFKKKQSIKNLFLENHVYYSLVKFTRMSKADEGR